MHFNCDALNLINYGLLFTDLIDRLSRAIDGLQRQLCSLLVFCSFIVHLCVFLFTRRHQDDQQMRCSPTRWQRFQDNHFTIKTCVLVLFFIILSFSFTTWTLFCWDLCLPYFFARPLCSVFIIRFGRLQIVFRSTLGHHFSFLSQIIASSFICQQKRFLYTQVERRLKWFYSQFNQNWALLWHFLRLGSCYFTCIRYAITLHSWFGSELFPFNWNKAPFLF